MQNKLRGVNVFGKLTSLGALAATSSVTGASATITGDVGSATITATSSVTCPTITVATRMVLPISARSTAPVEGEIHIASTNGYKVEWYSTGAWHAASTT